jgi:cephalosporin hydroxylase
MGREISKFLIDVVLFTYLVMDRRPDIIITIQSIEPWYGDTVLSNQTCYDRNYHTPSFIKT